MTTQPSHKMLIVCENTPMNRILIVKTSSLGDVIHHLPVIADIHAYYPNVMFDWVVEESFMDIPTLHPAINQIIPVAVRRWRQHVFNQKTWSEIANFKRLISAQSYDVVIDAQGLLKSAIMTKFAQGKKCGLDKNSAREPLASYFYDKKFNVARNQHAVARNRELAARACGYQIPSTAPNYGITANAATVSDLNLAKPYIIGLHGTSKDSKLWPNSHWIALGKALEKKHLNLVLPWASNAEQQRANNIAASLNNTTVLPKLSIAQLATIIGQSHAAIGVDTGLSHLAAALNIPTIAIYTDTNPALTGVYPGDQAPAINLGGIASVPAVDEILQALKQIKP